MKKVNIPASQMAQFAGKWVAIDRVKEKIIAVGDTLKEIGPFVTGKASETIRASAFKVPYKDEGPYIL